MYIAGFAYSINLLTVTLLNQSSGGPSSFSWDFGDGTTSTDENPTHTYSGNGGFFTVTLTVSGTDPNSSLSKSFGISPFGPTLSNTIANLVVISLPVGIVPPAGLIPNLIQKWQEYIQPIYETPEIPAEQIYNELAYPPLVNQLIIELCKLDIIIENASAYMMNMQTQTGGTIATGSLKKIETGPANAEWYQDTMFEGGSTLKDVMSTGGPLSQIRNQACILANRLRIPVSYCPPLKYTTHPLDVYYPPAQDQRI